MLLLGSEAGTVLVAIPAGVLLVAGGAKLVARGDTPDAGIPAWAMRPLGGAEVAVGAACLVWSGPAAPALMAAMYAAFAGWTAVRLARGRRGGCGCLWGDEQLDGTHLAVDAVVAGISLAAALQPPPALATIVRGEPWLAVPLLASLACGVYCVTLVMRHMSETAGAYQHPQMGGS